MAALHQPGQPEDREGHGDDARRQENGSAKENAPMPP
jgi:hypothetical protein